MQNEKLYLSIRKNERWLKIQFKNGYGWKARYDEESGRYFGEYGGIQEYNLYELTKQQYDALDKKMKESDAGTIMHQGRHSICQSMTDAVLLIRLFLTTTMKNSARGRTS